MFDDATTTLIRSAPSITSVDPETLPQELTRLFAELVILRVRSGSLEAVPERQSLIQRLGKLAATYEAITGTNKPSDSRSAAAFVAATAYQVLAQLLDHDENKQLPLLNHSGIHPLIAAPLLFLASGHNADAREAAAFLYQKTDRNLAKAALIETIYDLARERYDEILNRAARLSQLRTSINLEPAEEIELSLYGLCWAGMVQMVANLIARPLPGLAFNCGPTARDTFERVVQLSVSQLPVSGLERPLTVVAAGPRHLASLLKTVADSLEGSGLTNITLPGGAEETFWRAWLRHRAISKPVLWRNHRGALATGFLDVGKSAVMVFPTGAGKTTLSELKIAAVLSTKKKVVFLVPTHALVDQLRNELASSFPSNVGSIQVAADGDLTAAISSADLKNIEVMVPERCLALMIHSPDALVDVGLIVFDECHLLSPKGGGTRSLDAMLCLKLALNRAPDTDFLLLSAMLTNADELAGWVCQQLGRPCIPIQDLWKPSRQARGVLIYPSKELDPFYQNRATPLATPYALFGLQHNWLPDRPSDVAIVKLADSSVELSRSQSNSSRLTPNANVVAADIVAKAARSKLKTIVFVQVASHAPSTAKNISNRIGGAFSLTTTETAQWDDIKLELGGSSYSLLDPPNSPALPHNGDMLPQERRLAENIFRREAGADVIVATPTLAQGMNLPAQLAVLAGDKRPNGSDRNPLEPHELLNAAGRAGRAGHLANGVVLLIPEPVISFSANNEPEERAFDKLKAILPENDRCLEVEDPITNVLDLIQAGNAAAPEVQYFISRVQAQDSQAFDPLEVVATANSSFGRYRAGIKNELASFDEKVASLTAYLSDQGQALNQVAGIAAKNGLLYQPTDRLASRIRANQTQLPQTIVAWTDWTIDFLIEDRESFASLFGTDAETVTFVTRGKKAGGPITSEELGRLKTGLQAWLTGQPLNLIERALGVDIGREKCCPRGRDLVLKLVSRPLYLIMGAISELGKAICAEANIPRLRPAVLEVLPIAMRNGYDTPEKVAFVDLHEDNEPHHRVALHKLFAEKFQEAPDIQGLDYQLLRSELQMQLVFGDLADL